MINIHIKSSAPLTKETLTSINNLKVQRARSSGDLLTINDNRQQQSTATASAAPDRTAAARTSSTATPVSPAANTTSLPFKAIPSLANPMKKGQKASLVPSYGGQMSRIKACLGWNTNAGCDVDVSAFMLNSSGKIIGDDWFVFYGQTQSPDKSTVFNDSEINDRESITIDLPKISPSVAKIVFTLTINEALEKGLNFSMLKDVYIRILDMTDNKELISFKMDEYYSNVTSMMIGEIYLHNGAWKFNAIGNGVARDLAGLCEFYGVQVI